MAKFEWSEIFLSIEGEAMFTGWPTVYIRFTKCNFTCQKFNNPENVKITNDVLGFDPADYKDIYSIPLITKGCDSIYSWDKRFSHMWQSGDENDLASELVKKLPHGRWSHPNTEQHTILSLTGGEPTLRQKFLPALLSHKLLRDVQYLLIETNCSVPIQESFIEYLTEWTSKGLFRQVIWSNSPKLSISGEPWEKAINPSVADKQRQVPRSIQYFKFVCDDADESLDEVDKAVVSLKGYPWTSPKVYIMPVACTSSQQDEISAKVALKCIDRGYIYCHRVHNSVFGNVVGT